MPLGYELVAEVDITADTTQVDLTGLDYSSDDVLMLVSDIVNPNVSDTNYYLYANTLTSSYYNQKLDVDGSVKTAARVATAIMAYCEASDSTLCNAYIKLTEAGYFTWQTQNTREYGTSGVALDKYCGSKTAVLSSITSLSIVASVANGIGTGSKFKLYKLIAEPIADITVTADTTQVDLTGLSLDETNELLLVSDIDNLDTGDQLIYMFANGDTTLTNYFTQRLYLLDTVLVGNRVSYPNWAIVDSGYNIAFGRIKLTNSGHFTFQTDVNRSLGLSSFGAGSYYCSSVTTLASITSLSITAATTDSIGTGSRFKLYKLK